MSSGVAFTSWVGSNPTHDAYSFFMPLSFALFIVKKQAVRPWKNVGFMLKFAYSINIRKFV